MIAHLRKDIKSRVLNGHPWIYENEIESVEPGVKEGDILSVFFGRNFIGKGYYNPNSVIRIRILTRKNEEIDKEFFYKKILKAYEYRKSLFPGSNTYRLVFAESDGLPGLVIDRFDDYVIFQINTLGIYEHKDDIIESIVRIINPKGIYEKDDERSAQKEKFVPYQGWVYANGPELIEFGIEGVKFICDVQGQKTGFFLDQRINAQNIAKYASNKKVLDAFAYTGNFGIHSLKGGAKFVTFIDYSERALKILEETLKLNKFSAERYELVNANTFDYLRVLDDTSRYYDITVIDPPSLAKSRDSKANAIKGYKELNLRAMKITRNGGYLCTSSCTQIVYEEDFRKIIFEAAQDTGKKLTVVYRGMQSPDHPLIYNIFETEYLKHYFIRVENLEEF